MKIVIEFKTYPIKYVRIILHGVIEVLEAVCAVFFKQRGHIGT